VKISVRHGHLSDTVLNIIRDKAERLLHYFERLTLIEVTVDLKDRGDGRPLEDRKIDEDERAGAGERALLHRCRVEFVVQAEHKHDFVAHTCHPDVIAAVDLTLDKLEGQLRRYKEKIQDHRRKPSTGEVAGAPRVEDQGEE
jgi:putative sigma-54 modulation protein